MQEEMLSIGEAAKLMNVCENTLRDWDVEGKFEALRTAGGHRRYSLKQIREYLEENQPKKESGIFPFRSEMSKKVDKWSDWLDELTEEKERRNLAILLDNCSNYIECARKFDFHSGLFLNEEQMLWLTKEGWLRCRLKKIVSVQPMNAPASLVYWFKTNNDVIHSGLTIMSAAVAARTQKFNFNVFKKSEFENVKDAYADCIGAGLDDFILEMMKNNACSIENISNAVLMGTFEGGFDYLVGPIGAIDELKKADVMKGIDLYPIEPLLNEKTFAPLAISGNYPTSTMDSPIFCPYIIANLTPMIRGGTCSICFRAGWFEKEKEGGLQ